jgi:catechol 2,3-dioxygenase-like lactoylglutathione lyase family enzyme
MSRPPTGEGGTSIDVRRRSRLRIVPIVSDEPLFRKVDCLALPVPSLSDAVTFYVGLGHELVWRTETAAGLRLPESEAELVIQTERPTPEADLTVARVDEAVERFLTAGGRLVVEPFDVQVGRCAVIADPWDNHLVILDNSNGFLRTDDEGNVTESTNVAHSSMCRAPSFAVAA